MTSETKEWMELSASVRGHAAPATAQTSAPAGTPARSAGPLSPSMRLNLATVRPLPREPCAHSRIAGTHGPLAAAETAAPAAAAVPPAAPTGGICLRTKPSEPPARNSTTCENTAGSVDKTREGSLPVSLRHLALSKRPFSNGTFC